MLSDGVVAVPVDRDIRRRVFCSRAGYCYRLFAAIVGNSPTYRREDGTVEAAATERTQAAIKCFDGVRMAPIRQLTLPQAYYLPKSKCFSTSLDAAGFCCERPHEHERVIVAAPRDPVNAFLRRAARALTAVAKASGLFSISVEKLNNTAKEIAVADDRLDQESTTECKMCGETKARLCVCKIDAASFFTRCSRTRAVDTCRRVLRYLEHRGCTGVAFHPESRQQDTVTGRRHLPNRTIWSFALLARALDWLVLDCRFSVGDTVFAQDEGLAQGSPLSPVLARFTLDVCHNKLYKSIGLPADVRRFTKVCGRRAARWLAGKLHVDDALFWSRVLCQGCVAALIRAIWPADIGFSLESTGPTLTFLHLDLSFGVGPDAQGISAALRLPNAAFCVGTADTPTTSVCPKFLPGICRCRHLALCLVPKLWLCAESFSAAAPAGAASRTVVLLCCDFLRLRWPTRWVAKVLLGYKNFRRAPFTSICHFAGVWLRRNQHMVKHTLTEAQGSDDWACFADEWAECINCLPAAFWH